MIWLSFKIVILLSSVSVFAKAEADPDDWAEADEGEFIHPSSVNVQEAKTEYNRLVSYSRLPHFGSCWSLALKDLHSSCRTLTEDSQTFLAIKFANCFLEKSGKKTSACDSVDDIKNCILRSQTEPNFFPSYLNFFTHTQNICFYLQSEEWQKRAESQVNRLMDASHSVSLKLEESKDVQSQILDSQKNALISSEALVAYNQQLNESLTSSQVALVSNFRELQRSASETRMWIGDIADRISRLQSVFIDEFTGFYSLIFYLISGTGCFVLSSTNRTAGARLWLFLLLIVTYFLERLRSQQLLASFEEDAGGMPDSAFVTQNLNDEAWLIRKCFWSVAIAVLVYFGYKYEDLNLTNQRLIMGLHKDFLLIKDGMDKMMMRAGTFQVDGVRGSEEPNPDSSISVPDKIRDYVERFRRSMTPSFMEEGDSCSRTSNLPSVPEDEEESRRDRRSVEETPVSRSRKSREVSPLSQDRLTPHRVLRSSVTRESPVRAPSVPQNTAGKSRLGRRSIHLREPTPEETNEGLQHLSDITNQTRLQLRVVLEEGDVTD